MCCLIYKVLCRCLIGRNFIISHCLHFVKHFFSRASLTSTAFTFYHTFNRLSRTFFKQLFGFKLFLVACIFYHIQQRLSRTFFIFSFSSLSSVTALLYYHTFLHLSTLFCIFFPQIFKKAGILPAYIFALAEISSTSIFIMLVFLMAFLSKPDFSGPPAFFITALKNSSFSSSDTLKALPSPAAL